MIYYKSEISILTYETSLFSFFILAFLDQARQRKQGCATTGIFVPKALFYGTVGGGLKGKKKDIDLNVCN